MMRDISPASQEMYGIRKVFVPHSLVSVGGGGRTPSVIIESETIEKNENANRRSE